MGEQMVQIVNRAFVELILERFKHCLFGDRFSVIQRDKNRHFIYKHSLNRSQIRDTLCQLKVEDYWQSEPSKVVIDGIVHKFFMQTTLTNFAGETRITTLHVKFELIKLSESEKTAFIESGKLSSDEENVDRTAIISFHEAEQPAEYAFH